MGKSNVTVTTIFTEEGENASEIIRRSFILFIRRELAKDKDNAALYLEDTCTTK